MCSKGVTRLIKAYDEANQPLMCELQGILDEVDKNLLEPHTVPDKHFRQWLFNTLSWRKFAIYVSDSLRFNLRMLHFCLGLKHCHDEVKQFQRFKSLPLALKLALLNLLDIENVIDQIE